MSLGGPSAADATQVVGFGPTAGRLAFAGSPVRGLFLRLIGGAPPCDALGLLFVPMPRSPTGAGTAIARLFERPKAVERTSTAGTCMLCRAHWNEASRALGSAHEAFSP